MRTSTSIRRVVAVVGGSAALALTGGAAAHAAPVSPAAAQRSATCTTTALASVMDGQASVPANPTTGTDCIMRTGRGAAVAVKDLQDSLNRCYGQHLAVDGRYGPRTTAAVRFAQARGGVRRDGVYGPQTFQHMTVWATDGTCRLVNTFD